jgi:predicted nucleotidyltransferase
VRSHNLLELLRLVGARWGLSRGGCREVRPLPEPTLRGEQVPGRSQRAPYEAYEEEDALKAIECAGDPGVGRAASALRSQEEMIRRTLRFARRASERLRVEAAYIVGSRTRGDYLDESDIDVVIVARGVKGLNMGLNMKERLLLLADAAEPGSTI